MAIEKPEGMTEEHFEYLDELRESGRTNMFGAGSYLEQVFGLERGTASKYVGHWMETFSQRQREKKS